VLTSSRAFSSFFFLFILCCQLAPGYACSAVSGSGLVAAIEHTTQPIYAVQFHPEVDLTPDGMQLLRNFLQRIAKLRGTYTPLSRQLQAVTAIRQAVGAHGSVLLLLSGGVDSTVCAALVQKALGADKVLLCCVLCAVCKRRGWESSRRLEVVA
jgi:GMP synthase (glutamine-hydrolysing)